MSHEYAAVPQSTSGGPNTLAARWLVVLAVVLFSGLSLLRYVSVRPDLKYDDNFLRGESGNQLYRAQAILDGRLLYEEAASQYGPLPAYLHAWFSGLLGVSPTTTVLWHGLWSLAVLAVAAWIATRVLRWPWALAAVLIVLHPVLSSASRLAIFENYEHLHMERLLLLLLVANWTIPQRRSVARWIGLGLLLGVWQWCKFGGAFFAGFALLVTDAAVLVSGGLLGRASRAEFLSLLRGYLLTFAGFMVLQGALALGCFLLLSRHIALDVLWPAYMIGAYDDGGGFRWSDVFGGAGSLRYFALWIAPAIFAAGLTATATFIILKRVRNPGPSTQTPIAHAASLLLLAVFFAAGFAGYFAHGFLARQFAFCLFVSSLAMLAISPRWARAAMLVVFCVPALWILQHMWLPARPIPAEQTFTWAGGTTLYARSTESANAIRTVLDYARQPELESGFMLVHAPWRGGGWNPLVQPDQPLRNPMVTLRFTRPVDVEQFREHAQRFNRLLIDELDLQPAQTEKPVLQRLQAIFGTDLAGWDFDPDTWTRIPLAEDMVLYIRPATPAIAPASTHAPP